MQILTRLNKVIAYSEQGYVPVGNSALCVGTKKCYDDVLITDVDCVPTDIAKCEYYYIDGKFFKGATVKKRLIWDGELEPPTENSLSWIDIDKIDEYDLLSFYFWIGTDSDTQYGCAVVSPIYCYNIPSPSYMYCGCCHLTSPNKPLSTDISFKMLYNVSTKRLTVTEMSSGAKLYAIVGAC